MSTAIPKHALEALHGIPMSIENRPFIAVPLEVLERLLIAAGPMTLDPSLPKGCVEARPFIRTAIARDLKHARQEARLTQGQLAAKMKVSQTRISLAEGGNEKVGAPFVKRWLAACGLPEDWQASVSAPGNPTA